MNEGGAYTEKARIEGFCPAEGVATLLDIVGRHGRTGARGDGVRLASDVERPVKIRTGDEDALGLV